MHIQEMSRRDFFSRIREAYQKRSMPTAMAIDLTYRCNFNCVFCYQDSEFKHARRKELTTSQILGMMKEAKSMGICDITFSGGEPFVREDIFDILEYARKNGFMFAILTNGSLITKPLARKLAALAPRDVTITFNTVNEHTFEQLSRRKGSFDRVLEAILMLKAQGVGLTLTMGVTTFNQNEMAEVVAFAEKEKVRYVISTQILPKKSLCGCAQDGLSISPQQMWLLEQQYPHRTIDGRCLARKRVPLKTTPFFCNVGKSYFHINAYGQMGVCNLIDAPRINVLGQGLKKAFQKLRREFQHINKPRIFDCTTCDYIECCEWCPAVSFTTAQDFTSCSPYLKERAQFRFEQYKKELHADKPCQS